MHVLQFFAYSMSRIELFTDRTNQLKLNESNHLSGLKVDNGHLHLQHIKSKCDGVRSHEIIPDINFTSVWHQREEKNKQRKKI